MASMSHGYNHFFNAGKHKETAQAGFFSPLKLTKLGKYSQIKYIVRKPFSNTWQVGRQFSIFHSSIKKERK